MGDGREDSRTTPKPNRNESMSREKGRGLVLDVSVVKQPIRRANMRWEKTRFDDQEQVASTPDAGFQRKGATALVFDQLREMILDRKIEPGERIIIDQIAQSMSVSITPVREALAQLATLGLVLQRPYAGYSTAPLPSAKFVADLYKFRALIESASVQLAISQRRGEELAAELREINAAANRLPLGQTYARFRDYHEMDALFHECIVRGSGNGVFLDAYHRESPHWHMARLYIDLPHSDRAKKTSKEHALLIDVISANDVDRAIKALLNHLRISLTTIAEIFPHKERAALLRVASEFECTSSLSGA
jgi:DNA-binding GntR family transcriptional regulator